MAKAKKPSPVKLVVGAIFTSEGILVQAKACLVRRFGVCDYESPIVPFNHTQYYEQEMGPRLLRSFLSFRRLINPDALPEIKLYTNRLEQRFSQAKDRPSRRINLDPGYICAPKLVLATCKDFSHRIHLDRGIFAEVTLHFCQGTFTPWPWTFPDYKTPGFIEHFNKIRQLYLRQLKRCLTPFCSGKGA